MSNLKPVQFTRGVPPPESFAVARITECAQLVLNTDSNVILQYGPGGGYAPLRALIASQLEIGDDQVIIGQGSLQLQDTLSRILIKPGAKVFVENPTYDRTITILRRAGAEVIGIPLVSDGLDMNIFEQHLSGGERPVLLYTIPDFQNPSGCVLSLEKRKHLVSLSEKFGFWIIEDSPYRQLRYKGDDIASLYSLAPNRVFHMSSYSKLIAPGLRVGWVAAPPEIAEKVRKFSEDTYINPSYLNQGIVFEFIRHGWLNENIQDLIGLYTPRLEAMLSALAANITFPARWTKPEGGFFISLFLENELSMSSILPQAKEAGLVLTDGRGFFADGKGDQFIRLPFCALTPDEIQEGIARLSQFLEKAIKG